MPQQRAHRPLRPAPALQLLRLRRRRCLILWWHAPTVSARGRSGCRRRRWWSSAPSPSKPSSCVPGTPGHACCAPQREPPCDLLERVCAEPRLRRCFAQNSALASLKDFAKDAATTGALADGAGGASAGSSPAEGDSARPEASAGGTASVSGSDGGSTSDSDGSGDDAGGRRRPGRRRREALSSGERDRPASPPPPSAEALLAARERAVAVREAAAAATEARAAAQLQEVRARSDRQRTHRLSRCSTAVTTN
jgi:hypothetical protein